MPELQGEIPLQVQALETENISPVLLVDSDIYSITANFINYKFHRFPIYRKIESQSDGERNIV